ncbi:MAG: slipin family protein [Spirochaetales bacterium]|nr:slipin family protein [Spirochaetales bacterium]
MKITEQAKKFIHNLPSFRFIIDFKSNPLTLFLNVLFFIGGVLVEIAIYPKVPIFYLLCIGLGALVAAGAIAVLPKWTTSIKVLALGWLAAYFLLDTTYVPVLAVTSFGLLFSACFQLADHWERAIILRFGKFSRIKGPGFFLIWPVMERIADYVDTRIRSTDFSAETTLTHDTVPVNVDAIAFWMIWDSKKAILELENFLDAVILSAQTALRDAIGKHDLATLLSERDRLGREIQEILEAKTSPWGITILSIEIREIIIPKELEDAMSKRAQAERERQSRVILGTAEAEIAEKFAQAAERYKNNPTALHLRAMNMIYEGLKKNGSIMLVPSSALETMSLGTVLGATALEKAEKAETGKEKENSDGQG